MFHRVATRRTLIVLVSSLVLAPFSASATPRWMTRASGGDSNRAARNKATSQYQGAKLSNVSARDQARANMKAYRATGDEQYKARAQQAALKASGARVGMLRSQAAGLKAKADLAARAGKPDEANAYLDQAAKLSHRANNLRANLQKAKARQGSSRTRAGRSAAADEAFEMAPAASQMAAPGGAFRPAQARDSENPLRPRDAFTYQQVGTSQRKAAEGNRVRDVRKLVREGNFADSMKVLDRLDVKAQQGNFAQRTMGRFQVNRARRMIRHGAERTMKNSAGSHMRELETPRLAARMEHARRIDYAAQLVQAGAMSASQARAELTGALRQDVASLPRRSQSVFWQAQRALTELARAEQNVQGNVAKRFVGRVSSLVMGSASGALKSSIRHEQKLAGKLAKQGPEGAIAANLLMRHARTLAHNARDLGLNESRVQAKSDRVMNQAFKNLRSTIAQARKGDPAAMMLAYEAMETLRLENPKNARFGQRIEKNLGQFERDITRSSVTALDKLSRYSEQVVKLKHPEAMAHAAQVNAAALQFADRMVAAGVPLRRDVIKRINKVDDAINGRNTFGYRFRTAGPAGKAGVVAGQVAKGVGKVAMLPVKIVALPLKLFRGKPALLEQNEVQRKIEGLDHFTKVFAPAPVRAQAAGYGAAMAQDGAGYGAMGQDGAGW